MTTTWMVRCSDAGRSIDDAVTSGVISVDFAEATDVTGLKVDEIGAQLAGSKSRTATTRQAEMLYAFANEIAEGDAIILPDRARRQVVVGLVTGPYEWVESAPVQEDRHTRAVNWSARFGWDDLPEPVKHTVLHYQRTVLRLEDQEAALKLTEGAEGTGLPAVYSAPDRRPSRSAIDLRLERAGRNERLCTSCFIIRPLSEFTADAEICRVCE
jgi:predicted Mrr-cat superfamily restriction endonuclease